MQKFRTTLFGLFLGVSGLAQAADFSTADALFAKRDEGRTATLAAREAYRAIIDQGAKDADLLRAVEGLGRTYTYEGASLLSLDIPEERAQRKKVFNECWTKVAELISPAKIGYSAPLYWYFRATCLAQEAEVSNVLERLANLGKLNDAFEKGLATDGGDIFEGGGIKRVKAAVKGNPEAKGLPGGLYNPQEALKLIDEAINAEAYPGNADGFLFCENFRRKIMVLNQLDKVEEGKALAASTIEDFKSYAADGLIPEFIRAENAFCIGQLEKMK